MTVKATAVSGRNPSGRSAGIIALDIIIAILAIEALYYAFFINEDKMLQGATGVIAGILIVVWLAFKWRPQWKSASKAAVITRLVMIDEEGERLKEWYIDGETSLLIGKSSSRSDVDVDLSDAEYASIISLQHAVLNHSKGIWYLEDLDSTNGVGLRKYNNSVITRIDNEQSYRIDSGDLIVIANTRLLVK
ncbi:FHA domain-containing protein [Paenibacillus algorifonticola]|uniref:FHA domain-containing protein n=1 Tax=Paenibacillus sp. BIHB 4019 TaxID=1870819 RepID=A0A1B2DC11_9BACL|nr:FHA domain-containing protein [Paenibacillus sp. BIHB 4019]ANY65238.1 hypothetical protein BBD42_01160 [Paenibacillus sp. BIHB 4019]